MKMKKSTKDVGSEVGSDGDDANSINSESTNAKSEQASISTTTNNKRKSTKRKSLKGKAAAAPKTPYIFKSYVSITEESNKQLFGIQFNHFLKDRMVFACVGGYRCSIYECPQKKIKIIETAESDEEDSKSSEERIEHPIKFLMCYDDPDHDEVFYTVAWSYNAENDHALVAFGGLRSVIRVIDTTTGAVKAFTGHTNAINELKFHPKQPHLLLSASKDHAMRLWNIKTEICVAILGGVQGHRDQVLSADFDLAGKYVVSGGMDHSLKVWNLEMEDVVDSISASETYYETKKIRSFPTLHLHFPHFSTRNIHRNYVDCVKWFGDGVLSKSCENTITWWKPGSLEDTSNKLNATIMHSFDYPDCDIWFIRFETDFQQNYLAAGNILGKIFLWNLKSKDSTAQEHILSHFRCNKPLRQVSFSKNGQILIAAADDGTIWRWDKRE